MNQHTRNIIVDSLILVAFSPSSAVSACWSPNLSPRSQPGPDLITVMKKAEAKEVNASSEQEEKEARVKGMKESEQNPEGRGRTGCGRRKGFVNMTDPHGRTPVMWVCYANYNNIETTLKLEATRAPIWTGFWKTPAWKSTERTRTGGPRCTGLPGAGWTACPTC